MVHVDVCLPADVSQLVQAAAYDGVALEQVEGHSAVFDARLTVQVDLRGSRTPRPLSEDEAQRFAPLLARWRELISRDHDCV